MPFFGEDHGLREALVVFLFWIIGWWRWNWAESEKGRKKEPDKELDKGRKKGKTERKINRRKKEKEKKREKKEREKSKREVMPSTHIGPTEFENLH